MPNMDAVVVLIILSAYFLPGIIASFRNHHQRMAITVLNVFLGWTAIGWLAALIWSATSVKGAGRNRRQCKFCAEWIDQTAKVCPYCRKDEPLAYLANVTPIAKTAFQRIGGSK